MHYGHNAKKNHSIPINYLKVMASGRFNSNSNEFKFEQCKHVQSWYCDNVLIFVRSQEKELPKLEL